MKKKKERLVFCWIHLKLVVCNLLADMCLNQLLTTLKYQNVQSQFLLVAENILDYCCHLHLFVIFWIEGCYCYVVAVLCRDFIVWLFLVTKRLLIFCTILCMELGITKIECWVPCIMVSLVCLSCVESCVCGSCRFSADLEKVWCYPGHITVKVFRL
jgi:hypothetical protein